MGGELEAGAHREHDADVLPRKGVEGHGDLADDAVERLAALGQDPEVRPPEILGRELPVHGAVDRRSLARQSGHQDLARLDQVGREAPLHEGLLGQVVREGTQDRSEVVAVVLQPGAGLEDDSDHLGPVLRTLPDYLTQQTFVQGRFPPHLVEPGEVLVTGLACEASAINCAVDWQLAAEDLGGADLGVLAEGSEAFDGVVSEVTVPLDALSGKNIRIVLTVGAGLEFSSHDSALWLSPRILRP